MNLRTVLVPKVETMGMSDMSGLSKERELEDEGAPHILWAHWDTKESTTKIRFSGPVVHKVRYWTMSFLFKGEWDLQSWETRSFVAHQRHFISAGGDMLYLSTHTVFSINAQQSAQHFLLILSIRSIGDFYPTNNAVVAFYLFLFSFQRVFFNFW